MNGVQKTKITKVDSQNHQAILLLGHKGVDKICETVGHQDTLNCRLNTTFNFMHHKLVSLDKQRYTTGNILW